MADRFAVRPETILCMGCMELKRNGRCPNPSSCGWMEGTGNPSVLQLQPRTVIQRHYMLGRVLGQGGFGITYLAYDLEKDRKLAIKEYFPGSYATRKTDHETVTHSSAESRESYQYGLKKFAQEARTLARFRGHANILEIVNYLEANDTGYIVMEYLEGVTLAKYLEGRESGKLSFAKSFNILLPVMDALREIHTANIIHRDVSPDNIILCNNGPIKLIDFGAAKEAILDSRTRQLILKAGYTPWEQYLSDGAAGPWSDVYSLGATFYKCLTGIVPPEAPVRLVDDRLLSPQALGLILPQRAEDALIRALAVRARNRYQTMGDFLRDLLPEQPEPNFKVLRPDDKKGQDVGVSLLSRLQEWWRELWRPTAPPPKPPVVPKLGLRFTAGELVGETIQVKEDDLIIGRDPAKAHLVIPLPSISAAHVRVTMHPANSGVRIEDLNSRNGTFVRKAKGNGRPTRLVSTELLRAGDIFFLCDEQTATFEVVKV